MVYENKMLNYDDPDDEEEKAPAEEEEKEEEKVEEEEEIVEEEAPAEEEEEEEEEEEDEEEMVDPLETIRVKCEETEHCVHYRERLEGCASRVSSRSHTEEDCTEELFDFLHARDHCVAHKLFHNVK